MTAFRQGYLRTVSVPGMMAALLAAAAGSYVLLVIGQGVGHHLGRIFVFVLGFLAILALGCAAGALTRGSIHGAALLGLATAGLGTLGSLWIWIRLFTPETGVLLLIAAGLATVAMVGAIIRNRHRPRALLSAAIGASAALLILGIGLSISVAPTVARPAPLSTSTVGINHGRSPAPAVTED